MQNYEELISRIKNGDSQAFKTLIREHERIVVSMISRLISNNEDVKDVCQEVFVKVYRNISLFRFQSRLSTWIARIAYTTAINYLKKNSSKMARIENSYDIDGPAEFLDASDDPEQQLSKKDISRFIKEEIMKLPEQYRTVITLFHLNEFSHAEIEEVTGMPTGTVKNYLFRARKILKDKLEVYSE